jgi:hypothetical protein
MINTAVGPVTYEIFHPARVAVLIPSYQRPDSVVRVVRSLRAATEGEDRDWAAYVIAETDDLATVEAAHDMQAGVILNGRARSYAGAVNTAYERLANPLLFAGADDLEFKAGWLEQALAVLDDDPDAQVVGTNDLLNPYVAEQTHATHYLVRRTYLDDPGGCVDGPRSFLFEGYSHNFTDTEFIGTARARGVFRPCMTSVVEHLHYTASRSPDDATYAKGRQRYGQDEGLFRQREALWAS